MLIRAKLIVMYPQPKNAETFEKLYREEHLPMLAEKLPGKTLIVETKIVGSPMGPMPHYRIAEIHFPSIETLEESLGSPAGRETVAHALAISSGGAPIFLIAEETTAPLPQLKRA